MITITGGSGFIGTSICRRLHSSGSEFRILDKRVSASFPGNCVVCDVTKFSDTRDSIGGDSIIHLAAEHKDDVSPISKYYHVNVDGARSIAAAATARGIKTIVFTSSVAIYGFAPPQTSESGAPNPFNDYGKSKLLAEKVLVEWQSEDPACRTLVIVRPTVVFGPGNRGNVYKLLSFIRSGRFLMIGKGANRKSLAYVENLSSFLIHCVGFPPGAHIFNYVDGPDLTMNDLVSLVRERVLSKEGVGVRIPYWLGISIGRLADLAHNLFGVRSSISSIRVKKFCGETSFSSAVDKLTTFSRSMSVIDALKITIGAEFLCDKPIELVFDSE